MNKTIEAFPALIEFVIHKLSLGRSANGKAGAKLGLSSVQTSQCLKSPTGNKSWWRVRYDRLWKLAYEKGLADGKKQMTERVLAAVVKIYGASSNTKLANAFGATNPSITQWQQGVAFPTVKSLVKLL